MAVTKLSDVNFQSNTFGDVMNARFTHVLPMLNRMLVQAPDDLISPNEIGYTKEIPEWNVIDDDTSAITDGTDIAYNSLSTFTQKGVWIEREVGWSAQQIIMAVAGSQYDALGEAVANQIGEWAAKEAHKVGLSVLKGSFAAANMTTHIKDDSGNTINVTGLLAAKQLLGDNAGALTDIYMHSKVNTDAVSSKIVTYDKAQVDSFQTGEVGNILGMSPRVSDQFTAVASTYTSYLSAPGTMLYKFRNRPDSVVNNANIIRLPNNMTLELVRDAGASGGVDSIILRYSGFFHLNGMKWNVSTTNPTNAQLATGSNWTKAVSDNKLIRVVGYKSA